MRMSRLYPARRKSPIRIHVTNRHEADFIAPGAGAVAENLAEFDGNPKSLAATMLLVSVRDLAELRSAIAAQVDVIDLKEPLDGPLAPVDPLLWRQAAREIESKTDAESARDGHLPLLSAALGEASEARQVADQVPRSFKFAKVGPSGCDSAKRLRQNWAEIDRLLDDRIELVAVAYADWEQAHCLSPELVFEQAAKAGMRRCLLDTFNKDGKSSLQHLGPQRLKQLASFAETQQIWWTLAGSIKLDHLPGLIAARIQPHCFGVRGDVCAEGRTGILQLDRVEAWRNVVQELNSGKRAPNQMDQRQTGHAPIGPLGD